MSLARFCAVFVGISPGMFATATPLGEVTDVSNAWFSQDGARVILQQSWKKLSLWDTLTGEPVATEIGDQSAGEQSWFQVEPDAGWILAGSENMGSRLYDFDTGKAISPVFPARFSSWRANAALSPGGFRLITFEQKDVARIYDTKTGKKLVTLPLSTVESAAEFPEGLFEQNGKRAWILDTKGLIRTYDTTTWQEIGQALQHPGEESFSGLSVSSDGRFVAATSNFGDCGGTGIVRVWDATTRRPIGKQVEREWGASGTLMDGGKRILFSFGRGAPYIVKLPSFETEYYLPIHSDMDGPRYVRGNGDKIFISWGADAIVTFTDAASGELKGSHHCSEYVFELGASPVKDRAIALLGPRSHLNERPRDLHLMRIDRKDDAVRGEALVASNYVSIPNQKPLSTSVVRISPDGTRVVVMINGNVRLFQVADLKELPSTMTPTAPR